MVSDNIIHLELLYLDVINIYRSEDNSKDKWKNISELVHSRSNVVSQTYDYLKKKESRKDVKIDYRLELDQIVKQVSNEANEVMKASQMITALHIMFYDLLSAKGNYYSLLDGQKEMWVLKKKITYYVNVSIKIEQNIYFHTFILLFGLESLFNKHFYLGIDFEYTEKKIQLAQLNFEHNVSPQSVIWLINPNDLEPVMIDNFVKMIICNKYIKKILHGSDALDIPYIYKYLLNNQPRQIKQFTRSLIDTKYLCEYYKLNLLEPDNKCSIYDEDATRSAVYHFGVISEEKQRDLTRLLESMPHHHDIKWNIHKMPQSQYIYALYDVIFLKYFYYRIIYVATKEASTDLEKKQVINLYKHVLYELTQFAFLEKWNITTIIARCKEEVDPINNYMIRKPGEILKLVDIFKLVSDHLVTIDPAVEIDKIIKVNYFKGVVITIIKKMIYTIISKRCRVYKDKQSIWMDKLENKYIFDFFNQMGYLHLLRVFQDIEKILETRIRPICYQ